MNNGLPFSIVLVDDDEDDRVIIDDVFRQLDFAAEVKKFTNSKMLFDYLSQIDSSLYPSLIVLDNTLGETDAAAVLSELKNKPAYKNIRVVVYSDVLSPARQKELLSLGVYACYEKGNTMGEIAELAKELKTMAQQKATKP